MTKQKITTIEELGELLQGHIEDMGAFCAETAKTFSSIGGQLVRVEDRLERIETRLTAVEARLDRIDLRERVERIAQVIRDKLHVEV